MLVILTFALFITVQVMLISLFPYSGTGFLVAIPLSTIITSMIVFTYYWLTEQVHFLNKHSLYFGTVAILMILYVNLEVHQPEGELSARIQIQHYGIVLLNYNSLECDQLWFMNEPRDWSQIPGKIPAYVGLVHKCKDQIPVDGSFQLYDRPNSPAYTIRNVNTIQAKLDSNAERFFYNMLDTIY